MNKWNWSWNWNWNWNWNSSPAPKPRNEATKLKIVVNSVVEKEISMLVLTDSQKATCTLKPLNSKGNPAPVDGVPQWSSSNAAVVTVNPAADGLTAEVIAVGLGEAQVNCVADADMDVDEIREITALLDVQVKASEAVSLGIEAGTPVEQ